MSATPFVAKYRKVSKASIGVVMADFCGSICVSRSAQMVAITDTKMHRLGCDTPGNVIGLYVQHPHLDP